ncbi:cyclopropane-fatty-acyl-phospholipid synthase family protein [Lentzea sp. BCCO 10_0856]|uniref:Cyclopropane-fatty-acyl-phospholipid synthase family protein n=1 Tax=Lentzea miocenica TaxID=3095431 RepID=A0ABU4TE10_9PSEU|nr:cyclopropane-fatty-acyl-phospholipid synthase family protein [Lentzea sp. BCCO 10_0856]MDX8036427.1 cyclopropane-fatty-acyl-phospholipid synthase family protein [Lentzea sp. BCCO 10_0856]
MSTLTLPRPGQGIWPGLFDAPRSPLRARIAESLFRNAVGTLPVTVQLPDGRTWGAGGPVMRLIRPAEFFHRLGADAKIGFGEAYMVGDWVSDELADVLAAFAARLSTLIPPGLQRLRRIAERRQNEVNDVAGSRQNIHRHYDLSNELFATFLDETMTYSSALFENQDLDLRTAQLRKIDGVLDYAGVRAGSRVLEIGTGWGALAIRAAERGATVTSLTISAEQRKLALDRVRDAGFHDRVTVELRDYREEHGQYDAVVSVEMVEAVGAEYWPAYFSVLDRVLAPGGRVGLQAITMPHDRMIASKASYTWIHKYIFPGGLIPSVRSIEESVRDHTRLRIVETRSFGHDYAETLRRWRETFLTRWDEVRELGFDDTFRRMWEFYLAYSEAGFRVGYLGVQQFGMAERLGH